MNSTAQTLHAMAFYIDQYGLHTGDQFADNDQMFRFDICALAYILGETSAWPPVFFTDETASIELIESSKPAMAAIRAISDSLDSEPCETNGRPDYIEHVSNWAATAPIGATEPPTVSEVIGRIRRTAEALEAAEKTIPPNAHAA